MYIIVKQSHAPGMAGRITASTFPVVHRSLREAKKECLRLAAKVPSTTFYPCKVLKGYLEIRPNPILSPKGGVEYANVYD